MLTSMGTDPICGIIDNTKKMFDITIKDNYLTDVEQVREFAIKYNNWRISDQPDTGPRWKGMRSEKFKTIGNEDLLKIEKDLFNFIWKERKLKDWKYPSSVNYQIDETILANGSLIDPMITTYFHRNPARTIDMLSDFYEDRFHRDFLSCAGVIFLNPNPPPMTGTSILDGRNIKIINVENVYNRLISYDGYHIHGLTGCFGDSSDTDRLTIVFFIHERVFANGFD